MPLKLLIVDDDAMFVTLHSTFIRLLGIENKVEVFFNGAHALSYLDHDVLGGDFQYLIITDLDMPELDGMEFLKELQNRSYFNRCFITVVSTIEEKEVIEKLQDFPRVLATYNKPFSLKQLESVFSLEVIKDQIER